MKRIIYLFTVILGLIAMSACQDENVKKLKKEIATANASCPINLGISGDLLSIKYQEKENRVIYYFSINEEIGGALFLRDNKDKLMKQTRLYLSSSDTQQFVDGIVKAKASVMFIYKSPSSGKTVKVEVPYVDLKDLKEYPMSESEIQRLTIETQVELENSTCPNKLEEGMTMTRVELVDNYIVYYLEIDESLGDMNQFKRYQPELKENLRDYFKSMKDDMTMKYSIQLYVDQNIGIHYRYYGNKSKEYVDVIFTPQEISTILTH